MKKHTRAKWAFGAIAFGMLGACGLTVKGDSPATPSFIPADYKGKPYGGTAQVIPGVIQAESYDTSPNGEKNVTFAYQGTVAKTAYRITPDSIGLAAFGKGHVSVNGQPEAPDQVYVGWTETGEWLKYTVRVAEPGTYIVGGKFAAADKGGKVSMTFSPQTSTGQIDIPTTAGYQPGVEVYHVWEKLDHLAEINLSAGTYVMTFKIETNAGLNLDWFSFTKKS